MKIWRVAFDLFNAETKMKIGADSVYIVEEDELAALDKAGVFANDVYENVTARTTRAKEVAPGTIIVCSESKEFMPKDAVDKSMIYLPESSIIQ